MNIHILQNKQSLGQMAARHAALCIQNVVAKKGGARILAATGNSQLEFLDALTEIRGIPWAKVELFHLDEYVGLGSYHPASFVKYLSERLIQKTGIRRHHLINGLANPAVECRKLARQISAAPVDVAFVGIGENSHLAFNDPPADFDTKESYLIVRLDEACRRQQTDEGWFANLADVPERAISISIRQLLKAKMIIALVPDARKARAVKACLEGPISASKPASILRTHADTTVYLDINSAALLRKKTVTQI